MEGDITCGNSGMENAWGANPYRREAWEGGSRDAGSRDDDAAASQPVRRSAPTTPPSFHAAPAHALAGLRVVPLVAAVGFAVFLLLAVFQLAAIYGGDASAAEKGLTVDPVPAPAATAPVASTREGDGSEAASTPRSQWRAGELPFLYQIDPSWSAAPYAGADVESAGCGPTSLTMVYIALTGNTDYDPASMAAFSEENGYVEGGLTAWRLMSEGAASLGLSSHEVPADASRLAAELQEGRPVICSVGPGDFTEKGHFIVLAGVDDDGRLVVHDPNSPANSAQTWDVDRVLGQCRNLWAFERA